MKRFGLMLGALLLVGSGCGVRLDPKIPHNLQPQRQGSVGASTEARGMPSRVGWGTFTVFAIPIAPVHIDNGPGEQIVMNKIRETMASAGYRVVNADVVADAATPHLECNVKRFSFRNYTYLFPLVFTWGGVDLNMRLVDNAGRALWERNYTGSGFNLSYSFTSAANEAMEKALAQFGKDLTDDAFYRASSHPVDGGARG